jgi:predicted DNA-binding ribbon-helix-helix protein
MALLDKEQPSIPPPKAPRGQSLVVKRSVLLGGHRTGVTLEDVFWDAITGIAANQGTSVGHLLLRSTRPYEDAFWDAFKEIAVFQGTTIGRLIATIDHQRHERQQINLSSAIRLFILDYYRSRTRLEPPKPSGNPG